MEWVRFLANYELVPERGWSYGKAVPVARKSLGPEAKLHRPYPCADVYGTTYVPTLGDRQQRVVAQSDQLGLQAAVVVGPPYQRSAIGPRGIDWCCL